MGKKSWFNRLFETKEEAIERQFQEMQDNEKFAELLEDKVNKMFNESKKREEDEKNYEKIKHAERLQKAKSDTAVIADELKDSPVPFVNVISIGFSKENGIEVKLDYNTSFIRYLHANKIKASNDDDTIRLWLAHLADDINKESLAEDYIRGNTQDDEILDMDFSTIFDTNVDDDPSKDGVND